MSQRVVPKLALLRVQQSGDAVVCQLKDADLQGRDNHCIAVIGDGAITGGMSYEAMNHAGFLDKNMIVILNDNQQVGLRSAKSSGILDVTSVGQHWNRTLDTL